MLSPQEKKQLISYFKEDLGRGDVSAAITPEAECTAIITANENCVVAGIEETGFLLGKYRLTAKKFSHDGKTIRKGQKIFLVSGNNRKMLSLERICLNILGRMSGVATLCAQARKTAGKKIVVAVTRKTVPGFQLLDKKAAQAAGCWAHRKNLHEMVLLKDNHLKFFGSAFEACLAAKKTGKKFEIEAESEEDALAAAKARPGIIMLDNFKPGTAKKTIKKLRRTGFRGKTELSGGITLKNLRNYSHSGADIISMGELTKKARIVDFSMDIVKVKKGKNAKPKGDQK